MQTVEVADLREREARFRAMAEHGSDLICILAPDGTARYDSPSYTRVLGAPLAELHHRAGSPLGVIHPDDRARVRAAMAACVRDGVPSATLTCRHRHADGSWRTLECVATNRLDDPTVAGIIVTSRDVTERVQAEEHLRALTEAAPDAIITADADGRIRSWNAAATRLFGYTAEEAAGQPLTLLMPERYREAHARGLRRVSEGGEPRALGRTLEVVGRRKDGSEFPIELSLSTWETEGGRHYSGIIRDVTERVRAEEALRASEERFRTLIEQAPIGACLLDEHGVFTVANDAFAALYGYTPGELIGQHASIVTRPAQRAAVAARLAARTAAGESAAGEHRVITKQGEALTVFANTVQIQGADGRPRRASFAIDITARVRTEEALRASEEHLRQVQEHAPIGLALVAPDGRWLRVNPALCALVGYDEAELLTRTFQDVTHPDDLDADLAYVQQMLAGEIATYQMEKRYVRKDGTLVWVLLSVSLVRDAAGQPLYFIAQIQDIDARKRAEEALQTSNRELARSNAELEQFSRIASHDLRSPLNSIRGFARLLQMRYRGRLDAQADEYIDFITSGAARMQALIDALLAYARVDSRAKPFAPVDCAALLRDTLANLHATVEEAGATVTAEELPVAWGDASQLGQLLQNLIGNALKFRRSDLAPIVRIWAERDEGDNRQWQFAVRDNGIGIDPAQAGRIFTMFGRLHTQEEYEGTGIGLALCQKIVDRHGGRIWVESEPGQGATFRFTLPAAGPAA